MIKADLTVRQERIMEFLSCGANHTAAEVCDALGVEIGSLYPDLLKLERYGLLENAWVDQPFQWGRIRVYFASVYYLTRND
jgi:hypothetical protein